MPEQRSLPAEFWKAWLKPGVALQPPDDWNDADQARLAVDSALGVSKPRRGRPPKNAGTASATLAVVGRKKRKKGPKQLCPVPGCKNPAAPVFGMVCAKHKDVPKAQIKKYREARRAKKMKKAA